MPIIVAFHIPTGTTPPPPPTTDAWTEVITTQAFLDAVPTDAELVVYAAEGPQIRGNSGPYPDVLAAWNSVSFDPATGDIYAHGGGHTNYGGNEVYKGDMSAGTWTMIKAPSPYTGEFIDEGSFTVTLPLEGPQSTHTYSSVCWNPDRNTIMLIGPSAGYSWASVGVDTSPIYYLYEFNPSTLAWHKFSTPTGGYSATVYADGKVYSLNHAYNQIVIDNSLNVTNFGNGPRVSEHVPVWHQALNKVYTYNWRTSPHRLYEFDVTATQLLYQGYTSIPADIATVSNGPCGAAYRDGLLWFYGGLDVFTYDPVGDVWKILPSDNQPGNGTRTYSKFHYWPSQDKFVFVTLLGSVHLLDPAELTTEIVVDPNAIRATITRTGVGYLTITDALNATQDGDTVVISPGTYREAFRVDRNDITIQASGVTIDRAIYAAKATIVQYGSNLTIDGVTPYGFSCTNANNADGNGSLVRLEPGAVGLTFRNVGVYDTEGGMAVTGGQPFSDPGHITQGHILVEDCKVERCGGDGGQSHGIYVGYAESLTIRRSEFLNGVGLGHLIKARPLTVTIEDTTIDGQSGNSSRLIDMPCGGTLNLNNCTLVQSTATDNFEVIGISTESVCYTMGSIINITDTDITVVHPSGRLYKSNQDPVVVNCSGTNTITGISDPC